MGLFNPLWKKTAEKTEEVVIIMKRIFTAIMLPVMILILCSCGAGSNEPPIPPYKDTMLITMQEYEEDTPIGIEIIVESSFSESLQGSYFYDSAHSDWKQIKNLKKLPQREKSYLFRFTDKDGSITEAFLFEDDKYDYLNIIGEGVWRERKNGHNNRTLWQGEKYQNIQYAQYFVEPLLENELSLADCYNGSEKAIFVDIGNPSDWWDGRYIPDEWRAERANDVRYVFVSGILDQTYTGYFYNEKTGERLDSAYDYTYYFDVYDLVSDSKESLYTGKAIDCEKMIWEYLSRLNSR